MLALLYILGFIVVMLPIIGIYFLYMPTLSSYSNTAANDIQSSASELEKHVRALCSTSDYRNYKNKDAQKEAVDYIFDQLKSFGYNPIIQNFEAAKEEYKNIIAFYGDPNKERVVVGAHYDTFGDQHGADDNASGIAGMIEIARLLQQHQPKLDFCIELVAYANEERPFFTTKGMGSYVHAERNVNDNVRTKLMVCLEMIGYFNDQPGSQSYPIKFLDKLYPKEANFIAIVGNLSNHFAVKELKQAMKKTSKTPIYSINAPSNIRGLANSDHRNYWHFNQNAVMITDTSFFRNPNYHTKNDTPESLDFKRMNEVIKGTFYAITQI
ncbi:M28 family peptidase [Flammeovirga sp. EKP202]|uniref:M28 family peptidase n=1 Tax=Flammeovirga sp. EKP202 TaxID=2770592 RepID=UPI00165FB3BA|nr:M28 family peptidase [Flammeovirga sp. EKP202]MBD0402790.1 M28 family peptidase [Flammeovirga sp. EKP202]